MIYQDFIFFSAVDLKTLDLTAHPEYNLIVLDGTWRQARNIFHGNPILNDLKQVRVYSPHQFSGQTQSIQMRLHDSMIL